MSECPQPEAENSWVKGIAGMSFPRTGHGLLQELLCSYFGPTFNYCEFYHGCKCLPCNRPLNNYQKCHDFGLGAPQSLETTYIVQVRHPWPAIVSHFRFRVGRGFMPDTPETWEQHLRGQIDYYSRFIRKWASDTPALRRVILPYHKLVQQPCESLPEVIALFDDRLDRDRLEQVVRERDVRELQRWADFPYTSDEAMALVEKINFLGLPLI